MSWVIKAFSSSIGKKLLLAITGLALCGFLVAHLGGNLLLYVDAKTYNAYAEALHAQKILLPIAEVGLLGMFVLHLANALRTNQENSAARPVGYEMRQSKQPPSAFLKPASSVMYGTGIVVLLFLLLHLSDFRFGIRNPAASELEPFERARVLLRDPLTTIVYIIGSCALGYHVSHGLQSALQTLGVNHPKYNGLFRTFSKAFGLIVAVGFGSFPIWAWAFHS